MASGFLARNQLQEQKRNVIKIVSLGERMFVITLLVFTCSNLCRVECPDSATCFMAYHHNPIDVNDSS